MELRQRKRIVNSLPKFKIGTDDAYLYANDIGLLFSLNGKFNDSASNNINNYGGTVAKMIPGKYGKLALGLVDLTGNTVGMYNYHHSGELMINEADTSENNVNGVGYTTLNVLDTGSAYNDVKNTGVKNAVSASFKTSAAGLAVGGVPGAIVGGIFGLGAGIFGGRHAAIRQGRINRNAIALTAQINQLLLSYADTQNLDNMYYQRHGDTTGSVLLANRGKDLRSRKRSVNITKV